MDRRSHRRDERAIPELTPRGSTACLSRGLLPPRHRERGVVTERSVQGASACQDDAMGVHDRNQLLARGRLLELVTLGWNVVGIFVLAIAAVSARSVALAGFGLDRRKMPKLLNVMPEPPLKYWSSCAFHRP